MFLKRKITRAHLCSGGNNQRNTKRLVIGDSGKAKEPNSDEGPKGGPRAQVGGREDISSITEERIRGQ